MLKQGQSLEQSLYESFGLDSEDIVKFIVRHCSGSSDENSARSSKERMWMPIDIDKDSESDK